MDAAGAKTVAERSGNSFQCRVVDYFRDRGWAVLVSPYYIDASTDKPRESDLIVEKSYSARMVNTAMPPESVRLRLFIECKYVAEGTVFWMDPLDRPRALNWVHVNTPFRPANVATREQHYFQNNVSVAKLFASEQRKGDENDPIYRALNQCLNGYIYNQARESMLHTLEGERTLQINYPVLICSDFKEFYETSVAKPGAPTPIQRNFQLELNYAYLNRHAAATRDYFLLDVVDFTNIDAFITSLDREMAAVTYMLERRWG